MLNISHQEAFDKVARHLAAQGGPSRGLNPSRNLMCLYRGHDGRKCAFGIFIPDDEYTPEMEGFTIDYSHASGGVGHFVRHNIYMEDLKFFRALQKAHDKAGAVTNDPMSLWSDPYGLNGIATKLLDVAFTYGLSPAVVSEVFFPKKTPKPDLGKIFNLPADNSKKTKIEKKKELEPA